MCQFFPGGRSIYYHFTTFTSSSFSQTPRLDRISAPQRERESPEATNLITH